MKVYTVHAYRNGDREHHSYTVGVYSDEDRALKAAKIESDWRSGKYLCEVLEWRLNSGNEGSHSKGSKTIQSLPYEEDTDELID